jgi:predicted acyltransferase
MTLHAFWRAFVLVVLGIALRSVGHAQTYFTFEDTLTQIGLGYGFLFMLGFRPVRDQWIALGTVLVGYWLAFALYSLPGPAFDYPLVGVPAEWPHLMSGFAAHWNKNSNLAWAFDTWFLNLFPREKLFEFNGGGYSTLSFIPTLGTMILGLVAGGVLRRDLSHAARLRFFLVAGAALLAVGELLGWAGVCPVVKRIWTPSFTLWSGGWCFLLLAAFYGVIDSWGRRAWAFPLIVIGMNSIAAYCMAELFSGPIRTALETHLGKGFLQMFGAPHETLVSGALVLVALWLILHWMFRRRVFVRI